MDITRLASFLLLLVAAVLVDSQEFVSPGPSTSNSDPSISNAVHPIRSTFHVAWSGTNNSRAVSVVLFQFDGKNLVYPFEYVVQSVTNIQSYDWTVVTGKNLSFSNLFLFNLFYDGETSPVAVSETFNITDGSSSSTTTSSLTSTSSTASSSPTSSGATSASAAAATTTTAAAGSTSNQSGGLSTGAKIGIGIAVPLVALGGIALGYLLFRHRAKRQQSTYYAAPSHAAGGEQKPPAAMEEQNPVADRTHTELPYELPRYELHGTNGPTTAHEMSG